MTQGFGGEADLLECFKAIQMGENVSLGCDGEEKDGNGFCDGHDELREIVICGGKCWQIGCKNGEISESAKRKYY